MTDKVWLTDAEVGTWFGTTRQWGFFNCYAFKYIQPKMALDLQSE